ncbi:MAG: hypothetical protein ACPIOQ_25045 [Promethearchaeia archaeon]
MCQTCFSDCTVSRKYVEKEMNVFDDQLQELKNLPFATVKHAYWYDTRDEVVLKEDVAGLFQTTWELFVKDTPARATKRYLHAPDSRPHSSSCNPSLLCHAKGY